MPDPDPLAAARYSCVYWVDHLCDSVSGTRHDDGLQDGSAVYTFLKEKYLYWLEALSLLRAMLEGVLVMKKLENLHVYLRLSRLKDLVRDTRRFILSYKWIIENAPLQAYASALVFSPARSLVRELFKAEEPNWILLKPVMEADWKTCLQTLEGHHDSVESVAFSPDGKYLASASNDETVRIWETATGQCMQMLEGHSGSVQSVAFSPEGRYLTSALDDMTIKIWETATGLCSQTLEGHSGSVRSVAFSSNGKYRASASNDETVRIWETATGQCTQMLKRCDYWARSAVFSPDSKHLASASQGTVIIWETATGQRTQILDGHSGSVMSVAFSPDGKHLISASIDMTVKIWEIATGQCTQTYKGHRKYGPVGGLLARQ